MDYHIVFGLAISFGLRQSEILGLSCKHIDFNNGVLRIVQTLEHSVGKNHQQVHVPTYQIMINKNI
ncbi:tyrosine-type recombinase/integrase [Bacillus safensis]|uniref:tyrosine-type recombinase/integrase n=1 Tax=Bacillus safensis TaxID=561879 RepID=UPI0031FCA0F1